MLSTLEGLREQEPPRLVRWGITWAEKRDAARTKIPVAFPPSVFPGWRNWARMPARHLWTGFKRRLCCRLLPLLRRPLRRWTTQLLRRELVSRLTWRMTRQ